MIAVVPVRGGVVAGGGEETAAEAGGRVVLAGSGCAGAAAALALMPAFSGVTHQLEVRVLEMEAFKPAAWAAALAPHLADEGTVVLPATPDGRDLAPRLAAALGRPLLAGALSVDETEAIVARWQGRQLARFSVDGPFVATLLTGSGRAQAATPESRDEGTDALVELVVSPDMATSEVPDAEPVAVLEADPGAVDLVEAERIFVAGGGIGTPEDVSALESVAAVLRASVGATRVVTDAGLLGHERQIGTTGVSVRPRCYVTFGVSGAAQHLGGIGSPDHVIAVNLDRSCPMMARADLALVTDARGLLERLRELLRPDASERLGNA